MNRQLNNPTFNIVSEISKVYKPTIMMYMDCEVRPFNSLTELYSLQDLYINYYSNTNNTSYNIAKYLLSTNRVRIIGINAQADDDFRSSVCVYKYGNEYATIFPPYSVLKSTTKPINESNSLYNPKYPNYNYAYKIEIVANPDKTNFILIPYDSKNNYSIYIKGSDFDPTKINILSFNEISLEYDEVVNYDSEQLAYALKTKLKEIGLNSEVLEVQTSETEKTYYLCIIYNNLVKYVYSSYNVTEDKYHNCGIDYQNNYDNRVFYAYGKKASGLSDLEMIIQRYNLRYQIIINNYNGDNIVGFESFTDTNLKDLANKINTESKYIEINIKDDVTELPTGTFKFISSYLETYINEKTKLSDIKLLYSSLNNVYTYNPTTDFLTNHYIYDNENHRYKLIDNSTIKIDSENNITNDYNIYVIDESSLDESVIYDNSIDIIYNHFNNSSIYDSYINLTDACNGRVYYISDYCESENHSSFGIIMQHSTVDIEGSIYDTSFTMLYNMLTNRNFENDFKYEYNLYPTAYNYRAIGSTVVEGDNYYLYDTINKKYVKTTLSIAHAYKEDTTYYVRNNDGYFVEAKVTNTTNFISYTYYLIDTSVIEDVPIFITLYEADDSELIINKLYDNDYYYSLLNPLSYYSNKESTVRDSLGFVLALNKIVNDVTSNSSDLSELSDVEELKNYSVAEVSEYLEYVPSININSYDNNNRHLQFKLTSEFQNSLIANYDVNVTVALN